MLQVSKLVQVYEEMEALRSRFNGHYLEIQKWIDPRRGQFLSKGDKGNQGEKKFSHIINSKAMLAKRAAISGLLAGVASPARPWFKLETLDKDLMLLSGVRQYTFDVEQIMRRVLLNSNFYETAPTVLDELLTFSTAAMTHENDFDDVALFHSIPMGSFVFDVDKKGEVNRFGLEREMSASQMLKAFGEDNLSSLVKTDLKNRNSKTRHTVVQLIQSNEEFQDGGLGVKGKRFISVWFERGTNEQKLLRVKGFSEFPVYVIRTGVTGGDIYGTNGPGMMALGDVKALQKLEKEKAIGISKMVSPVLKGPPALKGAKFSNAPNSLVIYDEGRTQQALTTAYNVNLPIDQLRLEQRDIEDRIDKVFYVDLLFSISNMQGVQPRNQLELSQRNQESLQLLGPLLERLQGDWLSKVLERVFRQVADAGLLPEAPEELEGQELDLRFISAVAQAQKSVDVGNIERYAQFAGSVASFKPEALDKIDADAMLEQYALLTGTVPSVNKDATTVEEERQARAEAQAQAQQLQAQQIQADTAAKGSQAIKNIGGVAEQ